MRVLPMPFFLLLAAGCPNTDGEGTDKNDPGTDSGDTGDIDLGPPGCINLNGVEGDFATIAEAIEFTTDGDTVNVCAGAYTDTVVIDRAVAVVGEGSLLNSIDAPPNQPAFEIIASGASVSGFTVTTTRSGVVASGVADLTLSDLVFESPANYGVEASEVTNLTVTGCTFNTAAYGGLFLSGGSAVVDSSVFERPTSYGIWASDGAAVSVTNSIFNGVVATASDGTDGHAIFGDGATLTTMQNQVTANDLFGFWVQDGSLAMDGDVISDTAYGVIAFDSTFSAANVSIHGAQTQGIYASSKTEPISITDTDVLLNGGATTGLSSCSAAYADFAGWCGGILVAAGEVTFSGVNISDYENYGIYAVPYRTSGEQTLTITDTVLSNNGRWSLFTSNVTATIDGLSILGHREPDAANTEPCYGYVDQGTSAVFSTSDATITNSIIEGSEGWGLSVVRGTLDVTSSAIGSAECAGIIAYESTLTASANTFGYGEAYGAIFNYSGALIADGNAFVDTKVTDIDVYEDSSNPGAYYRYEYPNAGRDITSTYGTACMIANNTFSGGGASVSVEVSGCDIRGNTWNDYNGTLIQVYQGDASDPVVVKDNSADDFGGQAVYSTYGYAEVEDFRIGDTRPYEYGYAAYYVAADGTETLQYSYSYSYGNPVFEAYGYYYGYWSDSDGDGISETYTEYGYASSLSLKNVTVGNAYSSVVEASEGELEIVDLKAESAGGYGVYAYWGHFAPSVEIEGVEIGTTTYTGLHLDANSPDAGYALLSDIEFDVAGGSGVYITGFSDWSVSELSVLDAASYGFYADGSYGYTDYTTTPSSTYVAGTVDSVGSLEDVLVTSATMAGVSVTNGSVLVESSSASGGDASGLSLTSVSAWVEDSAFTGNVGYGMSCSEATFEYCGGTDLSGNTSGETDGCGDACLPI